MVSLYAARIEALGPGDFVRVQSIACGRDELLSAELPLPPTSVVLDWNHRCPPGMRCAREGGRVDQVGSGLAEALSNDDILLANC